MRAAYLLLGATALSLMALGAALGVFGMAWLLGLPLPVFPVLTAFTVLWANALALGTVTLRIKQREGRPPDPVGAALARSRHHLEESKRIMRGGRFRAKPPSDAEGN